MAHGKGDKSLPQSVSFHPGLAVRSRHDEEIAMRKLIEQPISSIHINLESDDDGILVIGNDGEVVSFNRKFQELWSMPDEIAQTKNDKAFIAYILNQLADPQAFISHVNYLYKHPKQESFDVVLFSDGRIFERYSMPQSIGTKILGRVWVFRDITKGAKIQLALKESVANYKALLDCSPESITLLDEDGMILFVNKKSASLFNKSTSQLVGRMIWDFIPKNTAPFSVSQLREVIRSGKGSYASGPVRFDKEINWFKMTMTPVKSPLADINSVMLVSVSISDMMNLIREIETKTRYLSTIIRNAPLILFALDKNGKFTLFEGKGLECLSMKPGEVLGKSAFSVYKKVPEMARNIKLALNGKPRLFDVKLGSAWFTVNCNPIFDEGKEVIGMMGIANDITYRKQSEALIIDLENALQYKKSKKA